MSTIQRSSAEAAENTPPEVQPVRTNRRRLSALAAVTVATLGFASFGATPAFAATVDSTIAAVQGTGAASPFADDGNSYVVQGVVTADERTGGYNGIYIQTAGSGGGDIPGASEGLFVYLGNQKPTLAIGDLVQATGTVREFNGLTQLTASVAGAVTVVTPAVGVPAATPLPDTVLGADRENLEGMLVEPTGTYKVASSHQLYNFGTLWLSAGEAPLVAATEQKQSGPDAAAIAAANKANRLLLDDGYSIQVSNAAHIGGQPYYTTDTVVRNGDVVDFPAQPYVLSYGFDDWRLQPAVPITDASPAEAKPTFEATNPRPEAAPAVGGDVRLASFNVFNYFTTLTSENSSARGAATAEQFAIQQSKIVAAINGLDADIVSLEEIENSIKLGDPKDEALGNLVDALNEAAGSEVWSFVPTPDALTADVTDFITTAIIYKAAAVTPEGASQTVPIDESVWGNAREPIAQTFSFEGKTITVVANHLKSKSAPSGSTGEPADGQGWFNEDRVKQAQATLAFTDTLKQSSGSGDIFLIGDFNAYAQEDPIDVFTDAGWTDLVPTDAAGQYTYSFNGELGSLDHVLASPSVASTVTGVGVWNINSPEWSDRGYAFAATEAGTPWRSSDHDPIVVGVSSEVAPVSIDLVTVNDFHGRIENESGSAAGGIAALSTAVKQVRAENPNTVFAAAGDMVGASTFTSFIQQDNPTIDALNAAGLDVSAVGNHEFDKGFADLTDRIIPRAKWEYLGANIYKKGTDEHALPAYYTEEFDGVTVGFVGAVTNELSSLVSPAGIAQIDVRDVTESVNAVADELRDGDPANGEADVVVLLVHEGAATPDVASATDPTSAFGKIVTGVDSDVDAIVSGHTHLAYNHVIDGRPVISSGQYGEKFSIMDIEVNPQTKELLSMVNNTYDVKTKVVNGTVTTYTPNYADDPAVAPIVADAVAKAAVLGAVKLGDITADFNRAKQTAGAENRGGESTLGNFVADVQLWSAQRDAADIQVALMNPGGLRADMKYASTGPADPDGNLTYKEAAVVQPFANTLVTLTLTGAQLKEVLEQQWQPATAARPFLKLGVSKSLTYTEDPTAAVGSHITNVLLNGEPVAADDSIRVVVNSFLASGGDNFFTLAEGTQKADSGKVDLESMVDYMAANSPVSPDLAQRAVGVKLTAPASGAAYTVGESVTADLSSLAFSAGEPAASTVELSIGGTVVGSSAIDPTIVDTTDEVGRASVTFTIPAGLSGAQQLTIAVPSTGTSIAVPITITAPVPAVKSSTFAYANTILGSHNSALKYTVVVSAPKGTVVTGDVLVYDGKKLLTTITLTAGDKGKKTVTLPKLKAGLHVLKSVYAGSDTVKGSTSNAFPVLLW
ncbi:MAG: ExeM/NucH family extracellular endonuclease [Leifsonia flava]